MNNSKKIIKNPQQKKKKEKLKSSNIWIIVSAVLVLALIGGLLFDQLYERTILTINSDKYHMSDLSYYFYEVEASYENNDKVYRQLGGSFWDMPYDQSSTETNRTHAKTEAVYNAIMNEILYKEAFSKGYTLTDDEKKKVDTDVTKLINEQLTKEIIRKNNFTKEYLTDYFNKLTIAKRFREDVIKSQNINEDEIKAKYKFEDYRQYDIEYLFISTKKTDDEGNQAELSATDKTAALNKIKSYYDKAKASKDWSKLVPTDEKELVYTETNFIQSESTYDDKFEAMMMKMENGAVSEVYEAENGYYIIHMVNNNSSERYNTTVENAITQEENVKFLDEYNKIYDKYKVKVNNKALQGYTMGNITI